jgi:hypothetical protein
MDFWSGVRTSVLGSILTCAIFSRLAVKAQAFLPSPVGQSLRQVAVATPVLLEPRNGRNGCWPQLPSHQSPGPLSRISVGSHVRQHPLAPPTEMHYRPHVAN